MKLLIAAMLLAAPKLSNPSAVNGHGYSPRQVLIAPDFCTDGGGVCLSDAGGVLPPVDTGAATTLYVGTFGNDSSACTTVATACLTGEGARRKIPKLLQHQYTIQFLDGGFSAGAYIDGFTCDVGTYTPASGLAPGIRVQGSMTTAGFSGSMTGTFASAYIGGVCGNINGDNPNIADWGTFTVAGAGWTTNALAGAYVCLTGGTGSGQCVRIYKNTSTVATIVGSWPLVGPDSTSTFSILSPTTHIAGSLLPRPPGASHYSGESSDYAAAFFVSGNNCPGHGSGFGYGFGIDESPDGGFLTNSSFVEPPISIHGFDFDLNDSQSAVSVDGANQLVDVSGNWMTDAGILVNGWNSNFYAISNNAGNDSFGNNIIQNGNYQRAYGPQANGFELAFGNYFAFPSSDGFTSGVNALGPAVLAQNAFIENDTAQTECGLLYGNSASVWSCGNEYANLGQGVEDIGESYKIRINTDGDDFTNTNIDYYLRDDSVLVFINNNQTGTDAGVVVQLRNGVKVIFGDGPTYSTARGSVADIEFTGPSGGSFRDYSWQDTIDAGAIWDLYTDSWVIPGVP